MIPIGRITNIAGLKSTGKSSLTDHLVANAQKAIVEWKWTQRKIESGREIVETISKNVKGLRCAILDNEGTKTAEWMSNIGVDVNNIIYSIPTGMEETLEMIHEMQRSGDIHLAVIDSIETMSPTKEMKSEMGESFQMGIKPKMLGEFCRKFSALNNSLARQGKLPMTLITLNQVREKIGGYGDPTYCPGGNSIPFYASIDIRLKRGDWITTGTGDNKEIIGHVVRFKTEKNKTYKQQVSGEFDFYIEDSERVPRGHIDNFKSVIMEAMAYGIIERAGAWFKYNGENIGQGAEKTLEYLVNNPEVYEEVKTALYDLIKREVENRAKSKGE